MIADLPQNMLIGLLAATLLGFLMGYLVNRLFAVRKTHSIVQTMRGELAKARAEAEEQISQLNSEKSDLRRSIKVANEKIRIGNGRQESNELRAKQLSQRVRSLEAEVAASEEQQVRLQRSFATYKSNKERELELARTTPGNWKKTEQVPVLNRRIKREMQESTSRVSQVGAANVSSAGGYADAHVAPKGTGPDSASALRAGQLGIPWSGDLDIPVLAESELPDSVEELEFELSDLEPSRGDIGG